MRVPNIDFLMERIGVKHPLAIPSLGGCLVPNAIILFAFVECEVSLLIGLLALPSSFGVMPDWLRNLQQCMHRQSCRRYAEDDATEVNSEGRGVVTRTRERAVTSSCTRNMPARGQCVGDYP